MVQNHRPLVDLLRRAYSAEKAAALAYDGHARSVSDPNENTDIRRIEADEWSHREQVLSIMRVHEIPVSKYYELKFALIGRLISFACHGIGWFMPFYFAGRLESGNVCEYFRLMQYFEECGVTQHHEVLFEMGLKEKEHELYFLEKVKTHTMLPVFSRLFAWGQKTSFNDVSVGAKYAQTESNTYCQANRDV